MVCDLCADLFIERAEYEAIGYELWWIKDVFAIAPASSYAGNWLRSFNEFPPRQAPGSFNLNKVMESMTEQQGSGR